MDQYSIQPYREPEVPILLRSINDLVDGIVKQAVQHPYGTGFSVGIVTGIAAKGFGAPNWLCFLIGLGAGYFTSEGLKKVKVSSYY